MNLPNILFLTDFSISSVLLKSSTSLISMLSQNFAISGRPDVSKSRMGKMFSVTFKYRLCGNLKLFWKEKGTILELCQYIDSKTVFLTCMLFQQYNKIILGVQILAENYLNFDYNLPRLNNGAVIINKVCVYFTDWPFWVRWQQSQELVRLFPSSTRNIICSVRCLA